MPPLPPNDFEDQGAASPDPFGDPGSFSMGGGMPPGGIPPDLSFLFDDAAPGLGTYAMGSEGLMELVTLEDDLLPVTASGGHTENLAEVLDEKFLTEIANDLLERIEEDIESRAPWRERFQRGMEMMGLVDDEMDDGPFPGASTAVMPIISEAAVQFWARALAEQVPSDGPVKGKVLGKAVLAQQQRADRIATYMNHDLMYVDRSWYADHSRMLFALPLHGSCFKKTYRDHNHGRNTGEYVSAEDFICNYQFTHLDNAPRYAHRLWRTKNEMRKSVVAGVYRDCKLGDPGFEDLPEETEIRIEVQDFDANEDGTDNTRHELYETYCELDIPGHEELDEMGMPTGVALPYIVTVDKRTEKVISIYRNWKEGDPLKRRRCPFTKYDFIPGTGFYGLGFFHLIGGLQQAATGALRAVIDGAATASLQGGFISKDASLKDQRLVVEPGVWKQLDATSEDLNKAFFTPPFKEPSPVLFNVIGFLVQRAEKFTSTTETMTGSGDPKGSPVGTTAAMIEQGAKVFSTVHRGLHRSLAEELRLRYDLIQEFLPVEGYPYDVEGQHEGLMSQDFAPGVSILPVSDPNIFTMAQRVAQAQAVYDLAQQNPDLIKRPVALRRVLEAINVPDLDEIFIGENQPPPPMDPVSEIGALLRGEPVQAYPDQDHMAHLQHYVAFMQNPQYGGNPEIQKQIGGPAAALLGQRLAFAWASHAQALGAQSPALSGPQQGQQGQGMGPGQGQPQQPQMAPAQLAQMAAQIAPGMVKVPGLPALDADNGDQQKMQIEQMKAQGQMEAKSQELQLKGQAQAQSMEMKAQEHAQKLQMKREEQAIKLELDQMKAQMQVQIEQMKLETEAQLAEQKAQMQSFQMAADMQRQEEQSRQQAVQSQQDMAMRQQEVMQDGAISAAELEQDQQAAQQDMQLKQATTQQDIALKKAQASVPKAGARPKPRKST
jgi:chaperonin GroES